VGNHREKQPKDPSPQIGLPDNPWVRKVREYVLEKQRALIEEFPSDLGATARVDLLGELVAFMLDKHLPAILRASDEERQEWFEKFCRYINNEYESILKALRNPRRPTFRPVGHERPTTSRQPSVPSNRAEADLADLTGVTIGAGPEASVVVAQRLRSLFDSLPPEAQSRFLKPLLGKLLSTREAAEQMGVTEVWVNKMAQQGIIGVKIGRNYAVLPQEVEEFKRKKASRSTG
jgi:hypothetical protein